MEGGCACGAIRYRLDAAPDDAGYCHCTICRRSTGAPVIVYATVPFAAFVVTRGRPRGRRSSDFGVRQFCGDCGSQLTMHVDHQPDTIDFTIGTLDDPDAVAPGYHIFAGDRIAWFETADRLPRHARLRPDTPGLPNGQTAR